MPESFVIGKPSISRNPDLVYEALRTGRSSTLPTYKELERTHPVLFTFVEYNARFSSIVSEVLFQKSGGGHPGYTEGLLIREVVDLFIKCNGISAIAQDPEELARAGAQTLAVRLFQQRVVAPGTESERVQVEDSYNYGVSLQATTSQTTVMTRLVHEYGLVIALPFDAGGAARVRYSVDPAMQLLALFMMGLSPAIDLSESGSFGYEVLSTHLVKCSIASTLAIQEDVRPSIQAALKKIGFELNDPHATISSEDDFIVG